MLKLIGLFILALAVVLTALAFIPLPTLHPMPKSTQAPDAGSPEICPDCVSITMDHGQPTEIVYVLLHGITNCPVQFRKFGDLLFAQGANVFIPRMPYHGYADRMTDAQKNFTAQVMLDEANRAIDHAKTLGKRVVVVGLSVNGTTAGWVAQHRADVDSVALFAPFFSPLGKPNWLIAPLANGFTRLPNFFVWWDPRQKENLAGSPHSYPRFATHSLAGTLKLGLEVFADARRRPPMVRKILVVTSGSDLAINNRRVDELVALWERSAPGKVITYHFPAELRVPHDFMDPAQVDQQIEIAYPVLIDLLKKLTASAPQNQSPNQ